MNDDTTDWVAFFTLWAVDAAGVLAGATCVWWFWNAVGPDVFALKAISWLNALYMTLLLHTVSALWHSAGQSIKRKREPRSGNLSE